MVVYDYIQIYSGDTFSSLNAPKCVWIIRFTFKGTPFWAELKVRLGDSLQHRHGSLSDRPLESSCFEKTRIFQEEQKTIYALIRLALDLFLDWSIQFELMILNMHQNFKKDSPLA